ncbi:MAG: 30S ribosomal protein S2 [Candidatus Omnitrophica bacterium]|nr:30S ribosomal protein S2 [Candidatus Omnitrophota bacterium]
MSPVLYQGSQNTLKETKEGRGKVPSELVRQLLEAGVHFGHKTSRWNPKMQPYIFGERSGIYIIDLERTEECLARARDFVIEITAKGEHILFVGTKKQAQEVIMQEAQRCSMFYVTERWPGGLLTNFVTVRKSIQRLKQLETEKADGVFDQLTKKEAALRQKELSRLKKNFSGIVAMERMPKAAFIVDTKKEETAVRECRKLGIAVIGLIDTNSDPDLVDYPIPGNDDAAKAIRIITSYIADAAIEGRKRFVSYLSQEGVSLEKAEVTIPGATELLPEEEEGIKEIEEFVEIKEKDEGKVVPRKSHSTSSGGGERARGKRKG